MLELAVLFMHIITTGNSVALIWLLLLPTFGPFIFGIKNASILCSVVFIAVLTFFFTPYLMKTFANYSLSLRMRFPIIFACSFFVSLTLEWIYSATVHELDMLHRKYRYLYRYDELTGMLNRYGLRETLKRATLLDVKEIGVVMCDLDYYKKINDKYGHQIGDLVLKQVYEVMSDCLTDEAYIHRFGGEEFIVIYFNSENSYQNAQKMLTTVEKHPFIANGKQIHLTISMGHVVSDKYRTDEEFNKLLKIADSCLYKAKQDGRNRLVSATVATV
jgi:diguanylate cyclase (GGDEF)-like protein